MTDWYKEIRPSVESALGEVLTEQCERLDLCPKAIAARAACTPDAVRAIKAGKRNTNLAAFIVLSWALHEEPRELFNQLLNSMGFSPGKRPILRA